MHGVLTLCRLQAMYCTMHCLPASRTELGGKDLPRGFSMAMTALCWLLTITERGHFSAAEQGKLMQQRGCCSVSCSPSCSRQRCSRGLCQDKSIPEQVTVQPALRTFYLCKHTTGNWTWKLLEKCVHVPSAYLGRQALPLGSSWTAEQPSCHSLYPSHLTKLRLQLRRSH